jgi:hypothetical protein
VISVYSSFTLLRLFTFSISFRFSFARFSSANLIFCSML